MMLGGFTMMPCGMVKMLSSFIMMFSAFWHALSPIDVSST
jgi:hypothetical protein